MLTNQSGTAVETTTYDPWGEVKSGGTKDKFQYTGQEKDSETGLNYYNFRYYNSHIRRFTQPDDILPNKYDPQQLNRYSYVNNNPATKTDPTGHCLEDLCIGEATIYTGVVTSSPDFQQDTQTFAEAAGDLTANPNVENGIAAAGIALALPGESFGSAKTIKAGEEGLYQGIGATGKFGEKELGLLVDGGKKAFDTPLGKRVVDVYNQASNTAHEAKTGYTSATKFVQKQVQKDISLIKSGKLNNVEWHFYTSPITGKGGPSKKLETSLTNSGIKVINNTILKMKK